MVKSSILPAGCRVLLNPVSPSRKQREAIILDSSRDVLRSVKILAMNGYDEDEYDIYVNEICRAKLNRYSNFVEVTVSDNHKLRLSRLGVTMK